MACLEVGEVVHRLHRVGRGATVAAKELAAHQLHAPAHASDTDSVAADPADGPGDMRAVVIARAVEDGAVVAVEVPAVHVVHVPVAVVIGAVASHLTRVGGGVGCEVGVTVVVALVDDADVDVAAIRLASGPRLGRLTAELIRR